MPVAFFPTFFMMFADFNRIFRRVFNDFAWGSDSLMPVGFVCEFHIVCRFEYSCLHIFRETLTEP